MRVINVIKIFNNIIESIDSFGVFEEQLSEDVVDAAETRFKELIKEEGVNTEDEELVEQYLEDGYSSMDTGVDITIIWSNI